MESKFEAAEKAHAEALDRVNARVDTLINLLIETAAAKGDSELLNEAAARLQTHTSTVDAMDEKIQAALAAAAKSNTVV